MAITPVEDPDDLQDIKSHILILDEFSKIVFVSQNAVKEAFDWIDQYWPQLPTGIDFFAVGKKTAQCAQAQGVEVRTCFAAMNSDELLAMPELQSVNGEKILICRGKGGLPRIGESLSERGAIVRYCELYNRSLPPKTREYIAPILTEHKPEDIVPVFSGETLQNLLQLLVASGTSPGSVQVLVPSQRVAQLAHDVGFLSVHLAKNASSDEMLNVIKAHL